MLTTWMGLAVAGLSPSLASNSASQASSSAYSTIQETTGIVVDVANYTPYWSLFGGALIGFSSILILWFFGQTAGISGIAASVLRGVGGWRPGFLIGLFASGLVATLFAPTLITNASPHWPWLALGGICVGLGTRTGGGCTSGHGVCGLGRARPRSIVAVPTFIFFGGVTVYLMRIGGVA